MENFDITLLLPLPKCYNQNKVYIGVNLLIAHKQMLQPHFEHPKLGFVLLYENLKILISPRIAGSTKSPSAGK